MARGRWVVDVLAGMPGDPAPAGYDDLGIYALLYEKRDKDQLARALTGRLVTYATGAAPQTGDGPEIEAIVRRVRARDYGLRTLVHEIVQSKLFRSK